MLPKYTFWFLLLRPSHFKKLWGLAKWEPENATFGHIKSYFDQSETTYSKQFFLKNIFFSVLGSIYSKNRCKLHCKSFINLHFMHKLYWMKTEWDQARFGSALKIQFNMKTALFSAQYPTATSLSRGPRQWKFGFWSQNCSNT